MPFIQRTPKGECRGAVGRAIVEEKRPASVERRPAVMGPHRRWRNELLLHRLEQVLKAGLAAGCPGGGRWRVVVDILQPLHLASEVSIRGGRRRTRVLDRLTVGS